MTELYALGGQETQTAGAVRVLTAQGWQVYLACGSELPPGVAPAGVAAVYDSLPMGLTATTGDLCEVIERLVEIIADLEIDLVHAHPFLSLLPAFLASRRAEVPMCLTLHGPCNFEPGYGLLHELCLRFLTLPGSEAVFCVSPEVRTLAGPFVQADRCHVLPNAVDLNRFKPTRRRRKDGRWAVVSRLDPHKVKGVMAFCRMAAGAELGDVDVYGDGEGRAELEALLADLGTGERVHLMGERRDIAAVLSEGYTRAAGMGRVVLEASAMNLPVCLVGYDGVKGMMDRPLLEKASWWNFSGRGLRNVPLEEFRRQIDALDGAGGKAEGLRPRVKQHHDEDRLWQGYARRMATVEFREDRLATDLDSVLRARFNDDVSFLRDADLFRDVSALLAASVPHGRLHAQSMDSPDPNMDRRSREIMQQLTGSGNAIAALRGGVEAMAAQMADQGRIAEELSAQKQEVSKLCDRVNELGQLLREAQAQADGRADEIRSLSDQVAERDRLLEEARAQADGRADEIRSLSDQVAERDRLLEEARAQADAQAAGIRDLEERAERDGREIESLRADIRADRNAQARQMEQMSAELSSKDAALYRMSAELSAGHEARDELARREQDLEALRAELRKREQEAHELYVQLQGIYQSTGWAILRPLYRVRYWLFPRGSRRERAGRAVMHRVRRARYWLGRAARRCKRPVSRNRP
ncbi:MAG: glycosyltransferase, partial [Phycisphaerae bacterium]